MLAKGEKVFIVTRRLFETDLRRHFVGEVLEASGATVRVSGYGFVFDETNKEFVRREGLRIRIFPLIDAGLTINVIPREIILEDIRYSTNETSQRVITDNKSFQMNISEFGLNR